VLNKIRSHLVQNAPLILRPSAQVLPKSVQTKLLLEGLKRVFHEALDDGDFEFLENKWLKVSIRDLDLCWYISYQSGALITSNHVDLEDVSFSGNLNDLVLIAGRKEDPDTLFFQRRLSIEGDTELGLEVKNLMDSIDLDELPKAMRLLLDYLADFVYKGMDTVESFSDKEKGVMNAYQN
jgi:predicted lipid carrier protein YhbT